MPVNTADLLPGGGGGNNPGGLVSATGIGRLSFSTAGSAVNPSLNWGTSEASLGFYRSAVSAIALSYGTLDLYTNTVAMSMRTYGAAPASQVIGQWGFLQNASGISVFYSSGASIYYFGGSTISAVQP